MTHTNATSRERSESRREGDSGLGLVELLIYMMLSVLILSLVGSVFINSLRTEAIVRTATVSTSAGQLAMQTIQRGVRNSTGLTVLTPEGHADDQVLRVRAAGGGADVIFTCQVWYYSASEHTIRMKSGPDGVPIPLADRRTWTLLTEGVAPGGSGHVFTRSSTGATVDIDFTVTASKRDPIAIQSSARSRTASMEAPSCV